MPRFVILRHEPPPGSQRPLHWDLMLESGETLRTWALAEPPAVDRPIAAEALADHRTSYLEYEGPVSGNRGAVSRWDAGTFQWERNTACEVVVRLEGKQISGQAALTRADENSASWQFQFRPAS